jgi:hypothetical protein
MGLHFRRKFPPAFPQSHNQPFFATKEMEKKLSDFQDLFVGRGSHSCPNFITNNDNRPSPYLGRGRILNQMGGRREQIGYDC